MICIDSFVCMIDDPTVNIHIVDIFPSPPDCDSTGQHNKHIIDGYRKFQVI